MRIGSVEGHPLAREHAPRERHGRDDAGVARAAVGPELVGAEARQEVESPTASPEGPDDPFDLACPPEIARQRLARIQSLGYDDIVLVSRRHDEEHLRQLRSLVLAA